MRTRGSGGILKLNRSPNWYITFYQNGKQLRESTGSASKAVAEGILRQRLSDIGKDIPVTTVKKLTYEQITDALMLEYKTQGRKSLRTTKEGKPTLSDKKQVDDYFKGWLVKSITTDALRKFAAKRQEAGAANATVNRNLALIRAAMNLAKKERKLEHVPYFPMLSEKGNERQGFVEPPELESLLAVLPENLSPLICFMYETGCRLGAAKKIEWSQVSFDGDRAKIEVRGIQTKNGLPLKLVLSTELSASLRKMFRKEGPVFCSTNLRKAWAKATNEIKQPDLLVHDLRRSGVRNLIRAGVTQDVAMKISGHRTIAVFKRYNITDDEDLVLAADKLEAYKSKIETSASSSQVTVMGNRK